MDRKRREWSGEKRSVMTEKEEENRGERREERKLEDKKIIFKVLVYHVQSNLYLIQIEDDSIPVHCKELHADRDARYYFFTSDTDAEYLILSIGQ